MIGSDDRIEPVEATLIGLASCVTEAVVLNCARKGVSLEGLEVKAGVQVDPARLPVRRKPLTGTTP